jgi:hypothetical protein
VSLVLAVGFASAAEAGKSKRQAKEAAPRHAVQATYPQGRFYQQGQFGFANFGQPMFGNYGTAGYQGDTTSYRYGLRQF